MDSRLEDLLADKMNLELMMRGIPITDDTWKEANNVTRQTHKRQ